MEERTLVKMYLSLLIGLLSISMVFAEVDNAKVHYEIKDDGQMTEEDVEIHYNENYIKIDAPPVENKLASTVICDFNQGLTQYRQAGKCFMLSDGFDTFSPDMDDWFRANNEVEEIPREELVFHKFIAAPFAIDRKYLPPVMQDGCEEIYPAVLQSRMYGSEASKQLTDADYPYVYKVYGPKLQDRNDRNNRTPRGFQAFGGITTPLGGGQGGIAFNIPGFAK